MQKAPFELARLNLEFRPRGPVDDAHGDAGQYAFYQHLGATIGKERRPMPNSP